MNADCLQRMEPGCGTSRHLAALRNLVALRRAAYPSSRIVPMGS
jgi:hypothetical protein